MPAKFKTQSAFAISKIWGIVNLDTEQSNQNLKTVYAISAHAFIMAVSPD